MIDIGIKYISWMRYCTTFAGFLVATEFVAMGTGALGTTFDISALVTAAEIVLQTLVHI